jgi:hypothetical protein
MRLPTVLTDKLFWYLFDLTVAKRPPDQIIGGDHDPYLKRWFLIPRNPLGVNIYFHAFLRSDDDRALHDHPWANCSVLLAGEYTEHTIAEGGIHHRVVRQEGDVVFRRALQAHRVELHDGPVFTLFLTGPKTRSWGFHCPQRWVPWREFCDIKDSGLVGKGCA